MISKNLLLSFRTKISFLDEKLIILLAKRRELSIEIARVKLITQSPLRDINREYDILNRLINLGKVYHLNENYIIRLFQIIIEDSIFVQSLLYQKKL